MSELAGSVLQPMLKASEKDLSGGTIASVVITGICVVFIGLIILILCVSIYGKVFDSINKKKAEAQKAELEAKAKENAAKAAAAAKTRAEAPVVEDGIEEEIVAVITAAVAAMSAASGKKLALRSISKAKGGRNPWSAAGIAENTRPF